MKKVYLFLIVLFPVLLYSQVEPRANAEELISVDIPFDNIKRIFIPNDAAVIHAVDLSVREKLKEQFKRDSSNYTIEVHLDNTPLIDDGMVYKTKSGSLPMYYPEYNIKVDLSSLTQNHYEMIEEEQIARKSDSPFSYVMIYRIAVMVAYDPGPKIMVPATGKPNINFI